MTSRYLRVDHDAIRPDADTLWADVLAAKDAFTAALSEDLDDEVVPRLSVLEARILALIARPARSAEETCRKLVSIDLVKCYEQWFPTRAPAMAWVAVRSDMADLGISLYDLKADTILQ